jgi:hypothetical protein
MKTRILLIVIALLGFLTPSCTIAANANQTTRPDGTYQKQTQLLAKLGGVANYDSTPDGMSVKTDDQASFTAAATAAATLGVASIYGNIQNTKNLAAAATDQAGIKAAAVTRQTTVKATADAAKKLGSNPEANTGAIRAVGEIFR